jgi:quercetin 2,3-dioxygenase
MSGPLSTADAPATTGRDVPAVCEMEVLEGRAAEVGGFGVRRVLPRREHRTVGAWCFVDHMGPGDVSDGRGLDIGPHPISGCRRSCVC